MPAVTTLSTPPLAARAHAVANHVLPAGLRSRPTPRRVLVQIRQALAKRLGTMAAVAAVGVLAGCATGPAVPPAPAGLSIDTRHTAVGQDSRVQFLILHFTDEDFASSLRILTQQKVSSHYLVSDETPPRIYRLVDENRRAWHAGLSSWKNSAGLNASSIGIEIVNLGPRPQVDGRQAFKPYPPARSTRWSPWSRTSSRGTRSSPSSSWATATSHRSARSTPARCFRGSAWPTRA